MTKPTTVRDGGTEAPPNDFIREIVRQHLAEGRCSQVHTRFPPEPNGYLHIGHAKSICLNFGIAREFGGICNLRMDDTNPTKEDVEYVKAICEDVRWLIAGWADHCLGLKPRGRTPQSQIVNGTTDYHLGPVVGQTDGDTLEPFFASDYFEQLYEFAVRLIRKGKAYVCDLSPEETDQYRGAPDRPGRESPWRNRSVEENLDLFQRMRAGEFPDGARTLRAKIDMASPNVWMRDPVLYRIRHAEHHHTGRAWCIYPTYDFAHCLSDYIEGITHSICTLEFEVHRPLYDWILENLDLPRPLPRQYEFARLNLSYTVMSKRKLLQLVREGHVRGWDDPRLPTLRGLRRRGVTPEAVRNFAYRIGITKYDGLTDMAVLEHAIRDDLNRRALRRLAVLRPLRLVITNYPEDQVEELPALNNPEDPHAGTRLIPFSRVLYIEQDDFMESPPPKFYRLQPGGEVRLKYAYIVRCDEVVKDENGWLLELRCTADLESKAGGRNAHRKVKSTIHWVSARHAVPAECRLYDRLFNVPEPDLLEDWRDALNPNSLEIVQAWCEPALARACPDERYQFERLGYFVLDADSSADRLVFNRTITLKDAWVKERQKLGS
ncbi:MAG: glutamine--tRNA ligase/YqeY domain fusion protein [Verrucomicrobiota bacterium]|nr:glutamine--tRNA ligase/YqeY domain fusion protein [Limisphaera sp.]MDW8382904.1 glutamine--tRNA ligase/YqeY domain fusion protein [Verrucomicrobiota bacterium]